MAISIMAFFMYFLEISPLCSLKSFPAKLKNHSSNILVFSFADGDDFLLFCESRRKLCYFMPLPQEAPAQTMALKLGLYYMPVAISYDPMHKQMYWTDEYGRIFRAFINNGSIELVVTGIGNPMGIELDLVGRNIYFADYYGDKINIASLDGAHQNVLVYVPNPQAIALDSESGYFHLIYCIIQLL